METLKTPLLSPAGEAKGSFDWPTEILGPAPSRRVLHEAVVAYQANKRSGTSSTKTRGLVSGGGRKPWKQKGTGNARSGSIRSPLWRKGGIIFGPLPRSYNQQIGPVKKLIALQTALFEKAQASGLVVIESLKSEKSKTSEVSGILRKASDASRTLLVLENKDNAVRRATRNLAGFTSVNASDVNALNVISHPKILFTRGAVAAVAARFTKG